jgi:hypothetical protein
MLRRIALLLVLSVLLAACVSDEPVGTSSTVAPSERAVLAGQWERAESSFTSLDGMIIEVQPDGGQAVILTVPENEYQFVAGDVKWRSIEATDAGFSFEDLVREEGSGATSYVEGVITVTEEGTLEMTFPTTGTVQEWVRVEG